MRGQDRCQGSLRFTRSVLCMSAHSGLSTAGIQQLIHTQHRPEGKQYVPRGAWKDFPRTSRWTPWISLVQIRSHAHSWADHWHMGIIPELGRGPASLTQTLGMWGMRDIPNKTALFGGGCWGGNPPITPVVVGTYFLSSDLVWREGTVQEPRRRRGRPSQGCERAPTPPKTSEGKHFRERWQ